MIGQLFSRRLLLSAILIAIAACSPKTGTPITSPFPTATEVRLVTADETGKSLSAAKALEPAQRKLLESALFIRKVDPKEEFAACFVPHHFFRYYDNAGKQVGEIAVCFCCNGVEISPNGSNPITAGHMLDADYSTLSKVVKDLGERTDIEC